MCTFLVNAQQKPFIISGKIKGLDCKEISIRIADNTLSQGFRRYDFPVTDESFTANLDIAEPTYLTISPGLDRVIKTAKGGGYYPVKSSLLQCIAMPGESINFSGVITDFVDAYPFGEKANAELGELNKLINPLTNESVNIKIRAGYLLKDDSITMRKMSDSMLVLDNKTNEIKKSFIKKNKSSIAAVWLLSDMMIRSQVSNEEASSFFKAMNKDKLYTISYYKEVAKRVDAISAIKVGNTVPEISSLNTYDGGAFVLSSLRGKYVVLDFWGTWCGPCIAGMPKMKEYREKYQGKVEIVGVAQESDNGEKWKKFLQNKPQYQWPHILNIKTEKDYILQFNVAGFPTKIIVDPAGVIVGRFVGEDDAIYKKLDELLFSN